MVGAFRRILPVSLAGATMLARDSSGVRYDIDGNTYLVQVESLTRCSANDLEMISLADTNFAPSTKLFSFGCLSHLRHYGAPGSFLVDMKGIRNLIFARALPFSDETTRRLLIACGALSPKDMYLYVGLGGAAPDGAHAAGEYMQMSFLNGQRGNGFGVGLKGHVLNQSEYGTTSLLGQGKSSLPTDRLAYSQMALIKKRKGLSDLSWGFEIISRKSGASLLDALSEAIHRLNIQACSLTVVVPGKQVQLPTVLGRVTRGNNPTPWKQTQDATDSAIEQRFLLGPDQLLVGFGNKLRRQEPDWHRLTGGREYQARGHIHATLYGASPGWPQHTTFHLKDIFLPAGTVAYVGIVPVECAFRIFPLKTEGDRLVCEATGRPIGLLHS